MHRPPPTSTLFPYTTLFRSDFIDSLAPGHQLAADRAVEWQLALVGGLYRRHRAVFCRRNLDQLVSATLWRPTEVEMIADEEEERRFADEPAGAPNRMSVTQRRGLFDKLQPRCVASGRVRV